MDRSQLISTAEVAVSMLQTTLLLDPYYKINVVLSETGPVSKCEYGTLPATWVLHLNANEHADEIDIYASVIDCMLRILFRDIGEAQRTDEVISKLTNSFVSLLFNSSEDSEAAPAAD